MIHRSGLVGRGQRRACCIRQRAEAEDGAVGIRIEEDARPTVPVGHRQPEEIASVDRQIGWKLDLGERQGLLVARRSRRRGTPSSASMTSGATTRRLAFVGSDGPPPPPSAHQAVILPVAGAATANPKCGADWTYVHAVVAPLTLQRNPPYELGRAGFGSPMIALPPVPEAAPSVRVEANTTPSHAIPARNHRPTVAPLESRHHVPCGGSGGARCSSTQRSPLVIDRPAKPFPGTKWS